jgi:TPR repeat protein
MPTKIICCISLPDATIASVPIHDFVSANKNLADKHMEQYFPCCGKSVCGGCRKSMFPVGTCPFCNSDRARTTSEKNVEDIMKRVEANDAGAICMLAIYYHEGIEGVQQDCTKAMELYARAADLGHSQALSRLGEVYYEGGDMKKAKLHFEAAAMLGCEVARSNAGAMESYSGNTERAIKHLKIAASAGHYTAMHTLITCFKQGAVSRESIDSILAAYNSSCVEMRSEARDAYILAISGTT